MEFVDAKAVECCQDSVKVLVRAIKLSSGSSLSCLWKLMGDSCNELRDLPDKAFQDMKGTLQRNLHLQCMFTLFLCSSRTSYKV